MGKAVLKTPDVMTVEELLLWEEGREGRFELHDGHLVTMQAERAAHNIVKASAFIALRVAAKAGGGSCRAWADGMAVVIDKHTKYIPDAMLSCGKTDLNKSVVLDPVVIVEVASPSTSDVDEGIKLHDYFRLPSVQHYIRTLIPERMILHHSRAADGELRTRFITQGDLRLDPPGLVLAAAQVFEDLPEEA